MIRAAVILGFACACQALLLPPYVWKCKRSDPNLNKCFVKNANAALPYLAEGEENINLPSLFPLTGPPIAIEINDFTLDIPRNVQIYGFDNVKISDANIDLANKKFQLTFVHPYMIWTGDYIVSGKFLGRALEGQGSCAISFYNVVTSYELEYNVNSSQGKNYAAIKNSKCDSKIQRSRFFFNNLFNGNTLKTRQMNHYIFDHWKDFAKDISIPVSSTTKTVVDEYFTKMFSVFSLNEMFDP